MKAAEFEEKEYEAFLYSQLERGSSRLWSPGQVLEHYLGFDRGIFTACEYLWRLKGVPHPLRGFAPYYFVELWHHLPSPSRRRGRLPRFRLNCFVQAKRPSFSARLPSRLAALGSARFYYRLDVDQQQQASIDRVAKRLAKRALFVYAAPVYHTARDLFRHSTLGTTVEHSTFPDITALRGHKAWYYNSPGGVGVRNQGFDRYESPTLEERLAILRDTPDPDTQRSTQSEELATLSAAIHTAITEADEVPASARAAALNEEWRNIDSYVEGVDAQPAVRHFLHVSAFTHYYNLLWLAVAEGQA